MDIQRLDIPEIAILKPAKYGDARGFFSETYNKQRLAEAGIALDFVQDNHAYSAERGTVRGLHFQLAPAAQDKLVRVVKGAILDVAVDIRRGSPTYGRHVAVEISADAWNQILVPAGFAHGYCTLTPDTEIIYKVTDYYAPAHDRGLLWNDPALGIAWPVAAEEAVLSDKDRRQPTLAELPECFTYPGRPA
ncbi:dTDP-4-dehydrorhamnose 3,5-epimerase [Azospirillum sp. ST 5-10]|uniref:dTDP-4-dehydrorhamnose 3,5-epimerase n=1 Tax=unclassified Azospirillum TaxID=2630922 RepID=UPI003F49D6EE